MSPNRSLSYNLFTVLICSLVYCGIFFSPVNAETEYPPIPVDTDYDTDIDSDGLDFYNFTTEYERENCAEAPPCWFDFNLDGDVNDIDLAHFAKDFGRAGVDFYEPDDIFDQAGIVISNDDKYQHHNFHQEGDEDLMRFFAVKDEKYEIEVVDVDFDVSLELYKTDGNPPLEESKGVGNVDEWITWTSPDDGVYYVKVYPAIPSVFGAITHYKFSIFSPTGLIPGTIYGTVKIAGTQTAIPYARIRTTAGGSAISFPNGVFIMPNHRAGSYLLTTTAAGYNNYGVGITVEEGKLLRINIEMNP